MSVVGRGQSGAQVELLAYALKGQPPHRAEEERADPHRQCRDPETQDHFPRLGIPLVIAFEFLMGR